MIQVHGSRILLVTGLGLASFTLNGCGSATTAPAAPSEDVSISGTAASAAGGALSGSGTSGTQAFYLRANPRSFFVSLGNFLDFMPETFASTACPTFKTTGSTCTASVSTMWLSYSTCNFGTSASTWTGTQALIMSAGTAVCGTFPNPSANGTLVRQFVSAVSSTTPSNATVTTASGVVTTIDHSTANLGNFNGDTISTSGYVNGGYGTAVNFGSTGLRSSINLAQHVSAMSGSTKLYDHSITGQLAISETSGSKTRNITGSITLYHNLIKVIATSTFGSATSPVVHTDSCCFPTAGTITTTFKQGSVSPVGTGSQYLNKTETLTFTGCGTATLVDINGNSSNVTLTRCL